MALALAPLAARAGQVVSVETTGVTPGAIFSVTATGLDATAANNRLTFTPPVGAPVTVAATSSALVDATKGIRRVSVRVPSGLEAGTATVSILNTATSDTTNVGAIDILSLSLPELRSGAPGATGLQVTLRAAGNANFVAGQTRVTFGAGVTVKSVTVNSTTELRATIDIAATAAEGGRAVSVTVPRQSLVLANAFTVAAGGQVNQDPTARFTITPSTAQTGADVAFDGRGSTDPDSDPLTYEWAFGDGAVATGATATHAFATAGPYNVTLTVRDGRGGTGSTTQAITITAPPPPPTNHDPVAAFTFAPASPRANESVAFDASTSSDQDGDALTYEWAFGDGATGAGAAPTHTFTTSTTFTVSLTVRDGRGGVGTTTRSVTVAPPTQTNRPPTAAFTATTLAAVTNQSIGFDATASSDADGDVLIYTWAFGDGATASGVIASHGFSAASSFTVTLTVNDGKGGTDSTSKTVVVTASTQENRAPTAAITAFASGLVNQPFAFSGAASTDPDGDALTYGWAFGDGASATGVDASHTFTATGPFTVSLTVTDGRGGSHTATRAITINAPDPTNQAPTARITAPQSADEDTPIVLSGATSTDPDGDTLSYVWDFGDGTQGTGVSVAKTYVNAGTFQVSLTVSDGKGGKGTATHGITINAATSPNMPPVAVITSADKGTVQQLVLFTGGASSDADGDTLSYAWTFGDGASATGKDVSHAYAAAGPFTVTLTVDDGKGGTDNTSKALTIGTQAQQNGVPTAVISGATAGVAGVELQFDGRGSSDPDGDVLAYAWTFGVANAAGSTSDAPAFIYPEAGTFTVTLTVTDTAGNSDVATRNVTITAPTDRAPPVVTLDGPTETLPGTTVLFTAAAVDNIGVVGVRFEIAGLDGLPATDDADEPYTRSLTLPSVVAPGLQLTITAIATDAAGNTGRASRTLTVTTQQDTTEPTIALLAPPRAAAGSTVLLVARAGDNRGVARVVFLLGGVEIGTDEAAPFEVTTAISASATPGQSVLALARAFDAAGNSAESAASIEVTGTADTTPPSVTVTAPAEVLPGARLSLGATAQDDTGVASVTFGVDGAQLPPVTETPYAAEYTVPPAALPGSSIAITAAARDFANNTGQAARSVKVVAPPVSSRGVILGEAYSDATGLPLEGVLVTLTGADAIGTPYSESTTTDARGRFVLRAGGGDARLVFTKAGHARVDRVVRIVGGQAVEAFDARLTPLAWSEVIVSGVLGGTVESGGVSLVLPAGTFAADSAFRLQAIGQQGLANRLPAGWSPAGAADILPHDASFAGSVVLRVSNVFGVPAGTTLVLVRYDETAGAWRVVRDVLVGGSAATLEAEVPSGGQYAFLVPDAAPSAPGTQAPGNALQGVSAPVLPSSLDTLVSPQPKVLFYAPGVKSLVTSLVGGAAPLSSGAHILSRVSERYTFFAGSGVSTTPYVQDLTFYQLGARTNALQAMAPATPSLTFEPVALKEGVITVELFVPGADLLTPVAGPDGGTAQGPAGETLVLPFGAVDDQTPIGIATLSSGGVGVPMPDGVTFLAGAQFDFSGVFNTGATFSVALPAGVTDASRIVLVQVRDVAGVTRLVLRAAARVNGGRLVSDTRLFGQSSPLLGVREAGRYAFVEVDGPISFAAGAVTGVSGAPLPMGLVTTDTLGIVSLTTPAGLFASVGRVGANLFTATNTDTNDTGSSPSALVAGAVAPVGIALVAQPPRVTSIAPTNDAVNVALSAPVVITFSEPIDPASVSGANASNVIVADGTGAVIPGALGLSQGNTVLTFRAASAFAPNQRYTVLVGTGVTDRSGRGLADLFQSSFESLDTAPPPVPPAGTITAGIPVGGNVTVKATQGTASPRDTVTVVNLTTGAVTPVLIGPNGGFEVLVVASPAHKLRVRIVDPAGNESTVDLGAFTQTNPDGSISTAVDASGGIVKGPGGTGAKFKEGTFPDGAIVTLKQVDAATLPFHPDPALADQLSMQTALEIDFGGATPQKYVDLIFPPRGDEKPDDDWIVTQVYDLDGQQILNVVDTAKFKQGNIVTSSPPCPGVLARGVYGAMKSVQSVGINYSAFYNQYGGRWPVRYETGFLPVGGFVFLPFMNVVPETNPFTCYPVLSGRATVVPNGSRVRIAGDVLAPFHREVVVTNTTRGTVQRFPRNVVEYTLDMTGSLSDSYTVKVNGSQGEQAVSSLVVTGSATPDTVVFRLDMDKITVPVNAITITNVTRNIVRTYNEPYRDFEVGVSGGAGDGYTVELVNTNGLHSSVAFQVLDGPYGAGNLLLKVADATIDPNQAEAPPGAPRYRTSVVLTSSAGLNLTIPDSAIVNGGIKYAFTASQADDFRLTVNYNEGIGTSTRIPSFRLTVTDAATGRVIKTITAPAPPKDEPLSLPPVSDDVRPPQVISGPTRINSFDPAGVIEFRFSESMDASTIANALNFQVKDSQGRVITGDFRVSDKNRRLTFVPHAPLRLAEEYYVTLKGNDSLGSLLMPGTGGGMLDPSGNPLPTMRLTLKTFRPRLVATWDSPTATAVKDVAIKKKTVTGPNGPTQKTYLIGTTAAGSGQPDKIISLDVSDPENPVRAGGSSEKAPTKQWITLLDNVSFTKRDGTTFTGDLAFASTFNTYYTFGDFYDVTDPTTPTLIGGKIFTTNPDNTTGFNSKGTYKILGFGKGVTMLKTSQGVTAYIAIENGGVMAANVSENVEERGAQDRILEPYYQGNYTDVVPFNGQLLAAQRDTKSLDVLTAELAPTTSVPLPDVPRRIATVQGLQSDINKDGLITPDEQFDIAVVGAEGAVLLVDIAKADNPQLLSRIPIPNFTLRGVSVDVERRRLFAADFSRIFMIDLSNPTQSYSTDGDGDGWDDRIIWTSATSANGATVDAARGLLYVPSNTGLDIWAVYDNCCDLGVDLVRQTVSRQVGDRSSLLAKEKLGLQTAIAKGLTDGSCGNVTVLEQGSGACLWKSNPTAACADNYQPGLSDHDFEVFFQAGAPTESCINALRDQFIDPVTKEPKEIVLSSGGTITFEDVTFFPMPRAEFETAKLNVLPPTGSGGSDNVGDMGLGRQQLLLKWLLEGEYITVPGFTLAGTPLEDILTRLKTVTKIPRLEGYEWANLMTFNLAKSKAYLRVAGATAGDSAFYDFSLKQLHDAGKAGIRATLARLVDTIGGNNLVLDITREKYALSGCRAITPIITNPLEWPAKPCSSFEEYVASTAAKSLIMVPSPNIFTYSQIVNEVNRFYRVKADQERILSDAQADAFIRLTHKFIADTKSTTASTFNSLVGQDPDGAQRTQNVAKAVTETDKAMKNGKVHVVPRVYNRGFRGGDGLSVKFFVQKPGDPAASLVSQTTVTLAGGDEQYLRYKRRADGTIELDANNQAVKLFELGPVDMTANVGQPGHFQFSIDLPQRTLKEAVRENNLGGAFFYNLDVNGALTPAFPASLPLPPGVSTTDLQPNPECNDTPPLKVTESVIVDGQTMTGTVTLGTGQDIIVRLQVRNLSGDRIDNIVACDTLGNVCYSVGTLNPGQTWTKDIPFTIPAVGVIVEGQPSVFSSTAGVLLGGALRLVSSCEAYQVSAFDPNPNPEGDKSTVMAGGKAVRWFRVVKRDTGNPAAGVSVTVTTSGAVNGTFTFTTDAEGVISVGNKPGLAIDVPAGTSPGTFTATISKVAGVGFGCSTPTEFKVKVLPFEYTDSLKLGGAVSGAFALLGGKASLGLGGALTFALTGQYNGSSTTFTKLNLSRSVDAKAGFGAEATLFKASLAIGATAQLSGPSATGTVGIAVTAGDKFLFPTLPLTLSDAAALGGIALDSVARANVMPLGPVGNFTLRRLANLATGYESKRVSYSGGVSGSAGASASIFSFKAGLGNALFQGDPAFSIGLGGEGKGTFGISFENKIPERQIVGTAEVSVDALAQLAIDAAKLGEDAKIDNIPADTSVRTAQKENLTKIATRMKTIASFGGGFTEGGKIAATVDESGGSLKLKKIDVTFVGRKQFGMKVAGGAVTNDGIGRRETIVYTVETPRLIEEVVKAMPAVTSLASPAGVAGIPGAAVGPIDLPGPTSIYEKVVEFIRLIQFGGSYTITTEKGDGLAFPLGFSIKVLGTGVDALATPSADHTLSHPKEKGVFEGSREFRLEDYENVNIPLSSTVGAVATVGGALTGISLSGDPDISPAQRNFNSNTGTGEIKTTNSAILRVTGQDDYDKVKDVIGIKYTAVNGPVAPAPYRPQDTAGPTGRPRYGLGGFHYFDPAGATLSNPSTLILDYYDDELPGVDESSIRIYRWSEERSDWDLVGGTLDMATNTVTTTVTSLGTFTLGARMPVGDVGFTVLSAQVSDPGLPTATTIVVLESNAIRMNDGSLAPAGTVMHVQSLAPYETGADVSVPFGVITTADASTLDGKQVLVEADGKIRLTVEMPGVQRAVRVLAFSDVGTALGDRVNPVQAQ